MSQVDYKNLEKIKKVAVGNPRRKEGLDSAGFQDVS